MTRRLAQQRMTLSDLELLSTLKSTSSASCAIPAVAELLVFLVVGTYLLLSARWRICVGFIGVCPCLSLCVSVYVGTKLRNY